MNPRRADTDRDGILDGREDPDLDGLRTPFEFVAGTSPRRGDTDGDGKGDGKENPDNDGLTNTQEQLPRTHPREADTDRDGWTDGAEVRAGTNPRTRRATRSGTAPPTPTPRPRPTRDAGPRHRPDGPRRPGLPDLPGRQRLEHADRRPPCCVGTRRP